MLDKVVSYEYAIIRIVPRVEREEFINVGVLLMCKSQRYIRVGYELDCNRLQAFAPYLDIEVIKSQLPAFTAVVNATEGGGLIATLPVHERFRWLTAKRSSMIQTSVVHGGLTFDLDAVFERLYKEYVLLPS